jgi:hypothetical protein
LRDIVGCYTGEVINQPIDPSDPPSSYSIHTCIDQEEWAEWKTVGRMTYPSLGFDTPLKVFYPMNCYQDFDFKGETRWIGGADPVGRCFQMMEDFHDPTAVGYPADPFPETGYYGDIFAFGMLTMSLQNDGSLYYVYLNGVLGVTEATLHPTTTTIAPVAPPGTTSPSQPRPSLLHRNSDLVARAKQQSFPPTLRGFPQNTTGVKSRDTMCLDDRDFTPLFPALGPNGDVTCGDVQMSLTALYENDCSIFEYAQQASLLGGICCSSQSSRCPNPVQMLGGYPDIRSPSPGTFFAGGTWDGVARQLSSPYTVTPLVGEDYSFHVELPFVCSYFFESCGNMDFGVVQSLQSSVIGRVVCLDHTAGDDPIDECFAYFSLVPVPRDTGYYYDVAWQNLSFQQDGTIYWTLLQGAVVAADSVLEKARAADCNTESFSSREECFTYCHGLMYTVFETAVLEPCLANCVETCPATVVAV